MLINSLVFIPLRRENKISQVSAARVNEHMNVKLNFKNKSS